MALTESQFNRRVDDTLLAIEEAVDESGTDIDYENIAGILTLTCENDGSQVIINRQGAAMQLWLAARNGGHHFDWSDEADGWVRDRDGAALVDVLNEVLTEQSGEETTLEISA